MIDRQYKKMILRMVKEKSPHVIIFYEGKDPQLVHVTRQKSSTGDIVDEAVILKEDLHIRCASWERAGFSVEK